MYLLVNLDDNSIARGDVSAILEALGVEPAPVIEMPEMPLAPLGDPWRHLLPVIWPQMVDILGETSQAHRTLWASVSDEARKAACLNAFLAHFRDLRVSVYVHPRTGEKSLVNGGLFLGRLINRGFVSEDKARVIARQCVSEAPDDFVKARQP